MVGKIDIEPSAGKATQQIDPYGHPDDRTSVNSRSNTNSREISFKKGAEIISLPCPF